MTESIHELLSAENYLSIVMKEVLFSQENPVELQIIRMKVAHKATFILDVSAAGLVLS